MMVIEWRTVDALNFVTGLGMQLEHYIVVISVIYASITFKLNSFNGLNKFYNKHH